MQPRRTWRFREVVAAARGHTVRTKQGLEPRSQFVMHMAPLCQPHSQTFLERRGKKKLILVSTGGQTFTNKSRSCPLTVAQLLVWFGISHVGLSLSWAGLLLTNILVFGSRMPERCHLLVTWPSFPISPPFTSPSKPCSNSHFYIFVLLELQVGRLHLYFPHIWL